MIPYKVEFETIPWEAPMEGLRFKVHKQGRRQLRLVEYTPDMKPHWCEKGHTGYVLDGQFEIRFAGVVQVFNPGDGIFIPSGEVHKHMGKALTNAVKVIFVEDV